MVLSLIAWLLVLDGTQITNLPNEIPCVEDEEHSDHVCYASEEKPDTCLPCFNRYEKPGSEQERDENGERDEEYVEALERHSRQSPYRRDATLEES